MNNPLVPRLNLAPKRRRPFSLRNPLDYLQLVIWTLFFPQALRRIVALLNHFKQDGGTDFGSDTDWRVRWSYWQQGLQDAFGLQWRYLTIASLFIGLFIFRKIDASLSGTVGCVLAAITGASIGFIGLTPIRLGINRNSSHVESGDDLDWSALFVLLIMMLIILSLTRVGWTDLLVTGVETFVSERPLLLLLSFIVPALTTFVCSSSAITSIASCFLLNVTYGITSAISLLFLSLILGIYFALSLIPPESIFSLATVAIAGILFLFGLYAIPVAAIHLLILRPEQWLFVSFMRILPFYRSKKFGHVTPIPLLGLSAQISKWLSRDWIAALHNINELLTYTQQLIPVIGAINRSLQALPNDVLLLRVSQLANNPFDWDLVKYASVSLHNDLKATAIGRLGYLPFPIKVRLLAHIDFSIRIDTPARAAAAGFLYLQQGDPINAAKAFSRVKHIPHGKEMYHLANCLSVALDADHLNDIQLIETLSIPTSRLLRSNTWPVISCFRSVVDEAQLIYQSHSRSSRSLALNRAIGKVRDVLKIADKTPQAERDLIITIAESWQDKLLSIATDIGTEAYIKPVRNPYVAGDPVEGELFIGREDIIKQIEELWFMSNQLQSVVLYGHRRMGKTSILKNLPSYLGNKVKVAYVNLLNLGTVSQDHGESEVSMALSDAISQTLSLTPPLDEDFLRLPSLTFQRFIRSISQQLKQGQGLIIALDEFEKIEELIYSGVLNPNFLGFLRGLLQEHSNIAFAFAGLHTLEEMTEDYFNPLFASILPIRVGFFTLGETRQLLANPAEDFTLDYQPQALDAIYQFTAGQPYLTQLIGSELVNHYNRQVFEQGRERSPIFTLEDLNAVIHQSDFFAKGRYYFTGVWNQAAQDTPGQQALLKVLAQDAEGLRASDIRRQSKLSESEVSEALKTLKRHDVVSANDEKWKIIVPLFRQWVLSHQ